MTMTDELPLQTQEMDAGEGFTEEQARTWLDAGNTGSVREIADIWHWHRSRVHRLLSTWKNEQAAIETKSETADETVGQTVKRLMASGATPQEVGAAVHAKTAAAAPPDIWEECERDGEIAIEEQPRTAIYVCVNGATIIRQLNYDDNDPTILIHPWHLDGVIGRLVKIRDKWREEMRAKSR